MRVCDGDDVINVPTQIPDGALVESSPASAVHAYPITAVTDGTSVAPPEHALCPSPHVDDKCEKHCGSVPEAGPSEEPPLGGVRARASSDTLASHGSKVVVPPPASVAPASDASHPRLRSASEAEAPSERRKRRISRVSFDSATQEPSSKGSEWRKRMDAKLTARPLLPPTWFQNLLDNLEAWLEPTPTCRESHPRAALLPMDLRRRKSSSSSYGNAAPVDRLVPRTKVALCLVSTVALVAFLLICVASGRAQLSDERAIALSVGGTLATSLLLLLLAFASIAYRAIRGDAGRSFVALESEERQRSVRRRH